MLLPGYLRHAAKFDSHHACCWRVGRKQRVSWCEHNCTRRVENLKGELKFVAVVACWSRKDSELVSSAKEHLNIYNLVESRTCGFRWKRFLIDDPPFSPGINLGSKTSEAFSEMLTIWENRQHSYVHVLSLFIFWFVTGSFVWHPHRMRLNIWR